MKSLIAAVLALGAAGAGAVPLVGLTSSSQLAFFDSATPGTATTVSITGLAAGDRLVGIDLRTFNQTLYGVSLNTGTLYSITTGGAATAVGTGIGALSATVGYGIDTNPAADALRLVGTDGSNRAISFSTGLLVAAPQMMIAPGVSGVAYTPVTPNTSLYYLNTNTDSLSVATGGFANPALQFVGNLGVDAIKANGFEIAANGQGFAALNVDGSSLNTGIYAITLTQGPGNKATLIGEYNGTLSGLTIAPVPEPGTYVLMGLGMALMGLKLRQRRG